MASLERNGPEDSAEILRPITLRSTSSSAQYAPFPDNTAGIVITINLRSSQKLCSRM